MRRRALGGLILLLLAGCGSGEEHGFLEVGASMLFDDSDRLSCGEATFGPKAGGLLDAFVTLKPQDCALTLHRAGDFLGFGNKLCDLHIANNKITSVYLSETDGRVSCGSSPE